MMKKKNQAPFINVVVNVPPGRLGIHLSNNIDGETCISAVNEDSPLADKVFQGDKVVRVDEIDVSQAGVEDILTIFQKRFDSSKAIEFHHVAPTSDGMSLSVTTPSPATSSNEYSSITVPLTNSDMTSTSSGVREVRSSHKSRHKKHHKHHHKHRGKHHPSKKNKQVHVDDQEIGPALPDQRSSKSSGIDLGHLSKEDGLPAPTHLLFDESVTTKKHQLSHVEEQNEEEEPLPLSMQFDDSHAKKCNMKGNTDVEYSPSSDSAPQPVPMQFDDSLMKANAKSTLPSSYPHADNHWREVEEAQAPPTVHPRPPSYLAGRPRRVEEAQALHPTLHPNPPSRLEIPSTSARDEISIISMSSHRPVSASMPSYPTYNVNERDRRGQQVRDGDIEHENDPSSRPEEDPLPSMTSSSNSGDVEEGRTTASTEDILADAVLVDDQVVYDAEYVVDEQESSNDHLSSTSTPHVVINQHLMAPSSVQTGEHAHLEPQAQAKPWWENRCFVVSMVLIVLIVAGATIGGIVAYLQGKGNGDGDIAVAIPQENDELPITYINTPISVDVTFNEDEEAGTYFVLKNITSNASNGTCVIDDDGDSITYTPEWGFAGTDQCIYLVCNENNGCEEVSIELQVIDGTSSTLPTTETFDQETSTIPQSTTTTPISTTTTTSSTTTTSPTTAVAAAAPTPEPTTPEPTPGPTVEPMPEPTPEATISSTTTTTTTLANLFYVDWNAGLFGKCVRNCEKSLGIPCGGIITNLFEETYLTAQQCCEVNFPYDEPSVCTEAEIDWTSTSTTKSTTTTGTTATTTTAITALKDTSNDKCEDAQVLNEFPSLHSGSTLYATPDFEEKLGEEYTCGIHWYSRGLWYRFVGRGAVIRIEYQLYSKWNNGDSKLSIFKGPCNELVCYESLAGADWGSYTSDQYKNAALVSYEFFAEQGETYLFLLTGERFSTAADYTFKVIEYPVPENDQCETAVEVGSLPTRYEGTTLGATPDFEEKVGQETTCGIHWYSRGLWYHFVGRGAVIRIEYQLYSKWNNGDSKLSIFKGPCNELVCYESLAGADWGSYSSYKDSITALVSYEFFAEQGETYSFLLTGERFSTAADYTLNLIEV